LYAARIWGVVDFYLSRPVPIRDILLCVLNSIFIEFITIFTNNIIFIGFRIEPADPSFVSAIPMSMPPLPDH
jgi:hypothetical protein